MATNVNNEIPEMRHKPCAVEVGSGNITEGRLCSHILLKYACPTLLHEIEDYRFNESVPIRIFGSPEAFDAAMWYLWEASKESLYLDEFRAIELLDFAWKYQSPDKLKKAAESLCVQADFANLHASSLINYHSSFLTYNLWTGKEDREKELLEEISRRGAEVLNYLSESKKMCFDTVKKILENPRLNVYKEKDIYDSIKEWRNNIANAVEKKEYGDNDEFAEFKQRWKAELLPLIRFEFFSIKDVSEFFDEKLSPLSYTEKMTLLKKNSSRNIDPDKKLQLPMLTVSEEEFPPKGGLNLEYLSQWRGYFIPFTKRTTFLKSEEDTNKISSTKQNLIIQPLKRDLYLLSVSLFNLQGLLRNRKNTLLSFSVAVIREQDKTIVSETNLTWKNSQSKYFMLSYPCLLNKREKYRIDVTNRENTHESINFFQPACNGQDYEDILLVYGTGNICGLSFAFANDSQSDEKPGTV